MKVKPESLTRLNRLLLEEQTARGLSSLVRSSSSPSNPSTPEVPKAGSEPQLVHAPSGDVPTPNEAMAAKKVLRTAQLQSVGNWVQQEIRSKLDLLESEFIGLIRAESPHLNNLDDLKAKAAEIIGKTFGPIKSDTVAKFKELAGIIFEKNRAHLWKHHGVQTWPSSLAGIENTSVLGATLSEHFDKMASDLAFRFGTVIRTGIEAGDTLDELVERLKGGMETVVRSHDHSGDVNEMVHGAEPVIRSTDENIPLSVKAIIEDDQGRILVLKDANSDWNDLPGGHLKGGETLLEGLAREVQEETGLSITQPKQIGASGLVLGSKRTAVVFFTCEAVGDVRLSDEHEDFDWISAEDLPGLNLGVFTPVVQTALGVEPASDGIAVAQAVNRQTVAGYVHAEETPEAIRKKLNVQIGLLDTTDNSISKVIQAALTAFANQIDSESADSVMGDDTKMGWIWMAVMDIGTCDDCKEMDGNRWDENYEPVGDGPEFEVQPPLHFGCFTGDTFVTPIGEISAVTKREYDGDMVRVKTALHDFTCTPNHPILTDMGWKAAKFLNQRSRIVGYGLGQNPLVEKWEHEHGKTTFHEVFEAFALKRNLVRSEVPTAAPDFHGDGAGSEVAVVMSDALLRSHGNSTSLHHFAESDFKLRDSCTSSGSLSPFGHLHQLGSRLLSAGRCLVRRAGESLDLHGSRVCHSCGLLFTPVTELNASFYESMNQGRTPTIKPIRHARDTDATFKECNGSIPINPDTTALHASRLPCKSQGTVNAIAMDAKLASNIVSGKTGTVEFHDVVSIECFRFHGYVFNCETSEHYYIANGIATHNCRCSLIPVSLDDEAPKPKSFESYLSQFSDSEQKKAFGAENVAAYRRGDMTANQLIGQDSHILTLDDFKNA